MLIMRIRTTYTNQDEAPLAAADVPDRPSGHPTSPSDTAVLGGAIEIGVLEDDVGAGGTRRDWSALPTAAQRCCGQHRPVLDRDRGVMTSVREDAEKWVT